MSGGAPCWLGRPRNLRPSIGRCSRMPRPWRRPSVTSPPCWRTSCPATRWTRVPPRNLITDVAGVRVGHAEDRRLGSGATAVVFTEPAVAAMDVRGGGPGTREGALLDPANTVDRIDAIALSGGSAYGLDAASGIQSWLREQGRGFSV